MTKNLDIASAEGEFEVNVDPSVLSAIKQQVRGTPSKDGPDDVFTLRYSFKPDSLDSSLPLSLSKDKDEYVLESSGGESHVFRGHMTRAKETECVLLYNSDTNSFDLRQLDYALRVNHSREKPVKKAPGLAAPGEANTASGPRPKVASKRPPKRPSNSISAANEKADDEDEDEDMLGLANELEVSLEDDSNDGCNNGSMANGNSSQVVYDVSESSDEDDVVPNRVQIIERSHDVPKPRTFSSPTQIPSGSGPVSLRGLSAGRRIEEDDLSSSEEE